ncbi:RNA polymerase sigma factor [Sorangium sp. So ce542]|uniref:RNA polymerase sigma factor n=1 Tax=Sorangium sp. So ce542 TaxID=3133316 RepID=UPI003F6063FF
MRPSFEEVYRSSHATVLRLLWRLGVESRDLEDVAHEVFLVVHRRLPDYQPGGSLNAWLSAIASRIALRHRQLARNVRELLSEDGQAVDVADPGLDAEQLHAQAETGRLVRRLIQHIEKRRRPIFILHDLDGVSMRDIAQAFHISQNTAWDRLRRARDEFEAAARRLDARDRHALGLRGSRMTLVPGVLSPAPLLLDGGARGLDAPAEALAAPLWARLQASLAAGGGARGAWRDPLRAPPPRSPGGAALVAMTARPQLATAAVTIARAKLAAAGAALFLSGAAASAGAIHALGPDPPRAAIEIRRDEIAGLTPATAGATPPGGRPAAPAAAAPATARTAPATAVPASGRAARSPAQRAAPRAAQRAATPGGGADIGLLGRADAALGAGRAMEALELLERHARRFPRGSSTEQREALAVRVLVVAGRRDEAAARAERFRAAFPNSLFHPSIDAALRPP